MLNVEKYLINKNGVTNLKYRGKIYACPHHVLMDFKECPNLLDDNINCTDCWGRRGQAVLNKLILDENKDILTTRVVIDTDKFVPGQAIMVTEGEEQFDIVVTEVFKNRISGVGGSKQIYKYDITIEDILNGKMKITLLHGGENEC